MGDVFMKKFLIILLFTIGILILIACYSIFSFKDKPIEQVIYH